MQGICIIHLDETEKQVGSPWGKGGVRKTPGAGGPARAAGQQQAAASELDAVNLP